MTALPIHALRAAEVFPALETAPEGLTTTEVQTRRTLYGPNVLRQPRGTPLWRKLIGHLTHTMALLLWAAGALAMLVRRPELGLLIWLVVLVNAAFSFWQEHRAEQAVATLRRMFPTLARVVRDGQELRIDAGEIVPGDVLVLAEGDAVPADARVVEEFGLRTNHATLTGEAMPARKIAEASLCDGLTELERTNLVFAGTSVVSGTARAVVYATGDTTQFGRIAQLTETTQEPPSPLYRDMRRATQTLARVAVGVAAVTFLTAWVDGDFPPEQALLYAIGVLAAIIPEGLLPTVTLSLAIATQRLAQRGVLVKQLAVVERLGRVSVICTDKSGTLTQNQMTAREVWVAGQRFAVSGVGYEPQGTFSPSFSATVSRRDLDALLTAALLCNNARLLPPLPERPQWSALGDQTEAALLVLALKGGLDEQAVKQACPRVHELPFDARRKRMSTVHRLPEGDVALVKGAPRELLQLCSHILVQGRPHPLDAATRAEILTANDEYASRALRVLALARRELPPGSTMYDAEAVERQLTFLGLVTMMDPPRPEVSAAIQSFRTAGIRMVMVTGDYGLTAESLARRIGMLDTLRPLVVSAADLEAMSDAELQAALEGEVIFARMAPEHKLRLVAAFQARGDVVAVTGDGANDAPALRKCDVGIAMGIVGTDVAKEASDVILTNDDFRAIVTAIEEGRTAYDNIGKFITYILASNVPELLPFILSMVLHIPLALTVPQILAIDLGSDILPALALSMERPTADVMQHPPDRRPRSLLNRSLLLRALWLGGIEAALCYGGFFWALNRGGWSGGAVSEPFYLSATTVFFAGVMAAQIGNVLACRNRPVDGPRRGWGDNRLLWLGIGVEILLVAAVIHLPALLAPSPRAPLPLADWAGLSLYPPLLMALERARQTAARLAWPRATEASRLSQV